MLLSQKLNQLSLLTGGVLSATLISTVLTSQPAQAILFNISEVGSDVVVSTTGGSLDLTGLALNSTDSWEDAVFFGAPLDFAGAGIAVDSPGRTIYSGSPGFFTVTRNGGWTDGTFESIPGTITATSGSGIVVQVFGSLFLDMAGISGTLANPTGYTNGGFSLTIGSETIASLGLTPGSSIVTSWGANADQQFTMQVATPVPEPLTMLGASAAIAFGAAFKRKSKA